MGLALLLAVGGFQLRATLWAAHSNARGHALIAQVQAATRAAASPPVLGPPAPCPTSPAVGTTLGLLEIPALDLTAPVVEGTTEDQLSVAVGHLSTSVLPGSTGTAVLEAHDVSYFVHIDQLQAGDVVHYVTACATYDFTVTGHQVVKEGSPVYNTVSPTLVLGTCWPTNALWFTPERLLVSSTESSVTLRHVTGTTSGAVALAPTVPAPPELVAQGITLTTNSVPMGTMQIAGQPASEWVQSPGPLQVEESAVDSYIAAMRSAGQRQTQWWADLAPDVAMPGPLLGAQASSYVSSLNVAVSATGSVPTGASLSTTVVLRGGNAPGRYAMTIADSVQGGVLHITSWTLTPA